MAQNDEQKLFASLKGFGKTPKKASSAKRRRPGGKSGGMSADHAGAAAVVFMVSEKSGFPEDQVIAIGVRFCDAEAKRLAKNQPKLDKLNRLNKAQRAKLTQPAAAQNSGKTKKASR